MNNDYTVLLPYPTWDFTQTIKQLFKKKIVGKIK